MVLTRLRSQGDALFKRGAATIVPWSIDDNCILMQSIDKLLPELEHGNLPFDEVIARYEFWANGARLDLYRDASSQGVTAGTEIFLKAAKPRARDAASATNVDAVPPAKPRGGSFSGKPTSTDLPRGSKMPAVVSSPSPTRELRSVLQGAGFGATENASMPPKPNAKPAFTTSSKSAVSNPVGNSRAPLVSSSASRLSMFDPSTYPSVRNPGGPGHAPLTTAMGSTSFAPGTSPAPPFAGPDHVADSTFGRFLAKMNLASSLPIFAGFGITTLSELCCHTCQRIAIVVKDAIVAYRLITEAQKEIDRLNLTIDWTDRLCRLYEAYNPTKVAQVPTLIAAYRGDEKELWHALREKYEPEIAAKAALATPMDVVKAEMIMRHGPSTLGGAPGQNGAAPLPHDGSHTDLAHRRGGGPPMFASGGISGNGAPRSSVAGTICHDDPTCLECACPACHHTFRVGCLPLTRRHLQEVDDAHAEHQLQLAAQKQQIEEFADSVRRLTDALNAARDDAARERQRGDDMQTWLNLYEQEYRRANDAVEAKGSALPQGHNGQTAMVGSSAPPTRGGNLTNGHQRAAPHPADVGRRTNVDPPSNNAAATRQPPPHMRLSGVNAAGTKAAAAMLASSGGPASSNSRYDTRRRLVDFYMKHAPEKLDMVDFVMHQWAGREDELERLMRVEPTVIRADPGLVV